MQLTIKVYCGIDCGSSTPSHPSCISPLGQIGGQVYSRAQKCSGFEDDYRRISHLQAGHFLVSPLAGWHAIELLLQ